MIEEAPGTFDICKICGWEDDHVQFDNPFYEGGANCNSLKQEQENFIKYISTKDSENNEIKSLLDKFEYDSPLDVSKYTQIHLKDLVSLFKILKIDIAIILDIYSNPEVERRTYFRFIDDELDNFISFDLKREYDYILNKEYYRKCRDSGRTYLGEDWSRIIDLDEFESNKRLDYIREYFRKNVEKYND